MTRLKTFDFTHPIGVGIVCLFIIWFFAAPSQAAEVAAKVQFVVGNVLASSPGGEVRRLKKGDRIYSGDTVKSGPDGSAQLMYRDRSRMAVRVNTEFKIEQYRYDKNDKTVASSIFSLLGGALRTVSGLIGGFSPEKVTVKTPLATIGIRGTDHEIIHITPDFNAGAKKVDLGTYNKVYKGATIVKTKTGNLDLGLNQVGYVGGTVGKILKPVRIKDIPDVIKTNLINKIPVQAKSVNPARDSSQKNGGGKAVSSAASSPTKVDGVTTVIAPETLPVDGNLQTIKTDTGGSGGNIQYKETSTGGTITSVPTETSIQIPTATDLLKSRTINTDTLNSLTTTDSLKSITTTTDSLKSLTTTTDSLKSLTTTTDSLKSLTTTTDSLKSITTTTDSLKSISTTTDSIQNITAPTTSTIQKITAPTTSTIQKITAPTTSTIQTVTEPAKTTIQKITSPTTILQRK